MKILVGFVLIMLCYSSTARAQEKPDIPFRISLVAAVAAHGADLATTEFCLGARKCTEARFSTQPGVFGATKMGIAALSLWGVAKIHESNRIVAIIVNVAMTGAFSAIAAHNTRETNRSGTP